MPSRPLTRTFSTPRPSSGLASTPVPYTDASPADVAAYLVAMRERGRPDARAVHRHADPDALVLAREVADRRAAASARPVRRGTTRDPAWRKPRDLWAPVAGQTALFDPNAPTQLALFGDAVPVDVLAGEKL